MKTGTPRYSCVIGGIEIFIMEKGHNHYKDISRGPLPINSSRIWNGLVLKIIRRKE